MNDTYVAYPQLERVARQRGDSRLKPARLLRFWYLLQALGEVVDRSQVLKHWTCCLPHNPRTYYRNLRDGEGVWWEVEGEQVRIYPASQLHADLHLELEEEVREAEGLKGSPGDFAQHLTLAIPLRFLHGDRTDPLPLATVARLCGVSRRTVQRHLKASPLLTPIPQWLRVTPCNNPRIIPGLVRDTPRGYFQRLPQHWGVFRRLPNRFLYRGPVREPAARQETGLGRLLRSGMVPYLPPGKPGREVWDGLPLGP